VYKIPRRDKYFWQFWYKRPLHQKNFEVWTAPVPKDLLDTHSFIKIEELAVCGQISKRDVVKQAASSDVRERAKLLGLIVDIYGAASVDPNRKSELLSPWELKNRWGELFGASSHDVPQIDVEDYLIRKIADQMYECGSMEGHYFGRFSTKKECVCAISDHMHKSGDISANTFVEYKNDQLEFILFDPTKYTKKLPFKNKKIPNGQWINYISKYKTSKLKDKELKKDFKSQADVLKQRKMYAQSNARYNRIQSARKSAKRAAKLWSKGI